MDELTPDSAPEPVALTREALIQEVLEESLAELEAKLRARLQTLTEEQLQTLLHS